MPKPLDRKAAAEGIAGLSDPTPPGVVITPAAGPRTVTDLATALKVEMVNVSHHLGVMKGAGLVEDRREGRFVWYSLRNVTAVGSDIELAHESGIRVTIRIG